MMRRKLRKTRAISAIIIFIFLLLFFILAFQEVYVDTPNEIGPEKEYYQCRACNLIVFLTEEDIETQGYIFGLSEENRFEDAKNKIFNLLERNGYDIIEYGNFDKVTINTNISAYFFYNISLNKIGLVRATTELSGLMKHTVFIYVTENRLIIKLPNVQETKIIDYDFAWKDLSPTIEEILTLHEKIEIEREFGQSVLKYMMK